jgi:hypothetical protein
LKILIIQHLRNVDPRLEVLIIRKSFNTETGRHPAHVQQGQWCLLTLASYSISFSNENSRKHGRGLRLF